MIEEDSRSEEKMNICSVSESAETEKKECSPQGRRVNDCNGGGGADTLMELAEMGESYDDEDSEDSDWEQSTENEEDLDDGSVSWFCTNCTMRNSGDLSHCKSCREYKNSGILKHGCFASRFQQGIENSSDLDVTMEYTEHRNYSTIIGFDERMLMHYEIGKPHPHVERPDRILAIASSLSFAGIFPGKCFLIPPREISEEELNLVHAKDNIDAVKSTKHFLHSYFTSDTYANKYSACAARLAAGFCSDLAISIMMGKARNGFSLVRPPGHHAGIKTAKGFCLHNNAAVAAIAAQSVGAKKVLIVDWDVHHGNGTQEIFEGNKSVLYISLHRHDNGIFYPGTGAADEVGILEGEGYSVNVPWKTGGVGDNDYLFAFQNIILPIASKFAPDFTIVSAGFDAARGDPLGCCDVTPAGYAQMTHMLCGLSQGKMLVILEGGYNLRSISSSSVAVVKVLLGEIPRKKLSEDIKPTPKGYQTVMEVLKIQSRFWPFLTAKYDQIQLKWAPEVHQKNLQRNHPKGFSLWPIGELNRYTRTYLPREGERKREQKRAELLAAGVRLTFGVDGVPKRPRIDMHGGRAQTVIRTPERPTSSPNLEGVDDEARDPARVRALESSVPTGVRVLPSTDVGHHCEDQPTRDSDKATRTSQYEAGESSGFARLRPFYRITKNDLREQPILRFPYAFNQTTVSDEALKIVESMRYDDITRNFYEYVNGCMYLAQAMVDSHTKVDQRQDHQDLIRVRAEFHKQREELLKERVERAELSATVNSLRQKLDTATATHDNTVKSLNSNVVKLREELRISLEVSEIAETKNEQLESQLEQVRKVLADSKRQQEEAVVMDQGEVNRLQRKLEVALVDWDDRVRENDSLTSIVNELKGEVASLKAQHSELVRAKEVRQGMLNDISDFGARVYRRWDLPRDFARKVAEWVATNEDKVANARERWARMDQGEEVSSDEELDDTDTEGVHLEDTEDEENDDASDNDE